MTDLYATLGVKPGATANEIRKAFRQMSKTCHPDLFPGDAGAAERFVALEEAHRILTDVNERAFYDAHGKMRPRGSTAEEAVRAKVLDRVTDLLCRAIDECESLTGSDIIAFMRQTNAKSRRDITERVKEARERLKRATVVIERLKVKKGEENALRSILSGQMQAIQDFINKSPQDFELIKQTDEFLRDYEYEMDKRLVAPASELIGAATMFDNPPGWLRFRG